MASVSAETLILFIASMIIAAAVAGTFTNSVGKLSDALDDQGIQVSEEVRSDVEVISDSGSDAVFNGTSGNVTLLVKNTGTRDLLADRAAIDVLVDGRYVTAFEVSLVGDATEWAPGEVVRVEVSTDISQGSGDHRSKVIVDGDQEVFEFRA